MRHFVRVLSLLGLLLVFTTTSGRFAHAADPPAKPSKSERSEGARLKKEADVLMDQDKYVDANALYARAYELTKDPALLYNQGKALEAMGEYPEALDKLEAFDKEAPPSLRAKVPALHDLITDLRGRIATLLITSNAPGARVLVRDKAAGVLKDKQLKVRTRAGAATIEVVADGYLPFKKDVDLGSGSTVRIDAQLALKKLDALIIIRTKPTASIEIDGKQLGRAPLEVKVGAGSHTLVATAPGLETERVPMTLALGDRREVDIELHEPPGPLSKWWFWTAAGIIVAGTVTTIVALNTERSPDPGTFGDPPRAVPGP